MEKYINRSLWIVFATIVLSLASCGIEPSIDDYDIYVMVKGIDEETHNPVAKIYKNNVLLFEGENDKYISYSDLQIEAGHVYFIKTSFDETTKEYTRQMYKDFQLYSTLEFITKEMFGPVILGFHQNHYLYCYHTQTSNNDNYTYTDPEPISIWQFGTDNREYCTLDNTQSIVNQHTVSKFYYDEKTGNSYFIGQAVISNNDVVATGSRNTCDVFWKNGVENVMPNGYFDRPTGCSPSTPYPNGFQIINNEVAFGGWGYYWQGNQPVFLQSPDETVMSMATYNNHLYVLTSKKQEEKDMNSTSYRYVTYYKNAYIYKDGRLVLENDKVRNPNDLYLIKGDCYYSATDMTGDLPLFTIWKNDDTLYQFEQVETETNMLPDPYTLAYGEAAHNYFILLKK